MSKMIQRLLAFCLLVLLALPSFAATRPYSADYTVHYNGFKIGEMRQRYSAGKNGQWVLETEMKTTGLLSWFKSDKVTERSSMQFENGVPHPLRYSYHYRGNHKEVVERLDFDWQKNTITSLRDGKTTTLRLPPEVQDKLSYQIAMRHDLRNGKKDFLYRVADRSKIEEYELQVVGAEPQVTSFGTVDTVVVKKGTTTLWLAKDYDYLVVKIEQKEDGNTATSYITSKAPFAVDTSANPPAAANRPPAAD